MPNATLSHMLRPFWSEQCLAALGAFSKASRTCLLRESSGTRPHVDVSSDVPPAQPHANVLTCAVKMKFHELKFQ